MRREFPELPPSGPARTPKLASDRRSADTGLGLPQRQAQRRQREDYRREYSLCGLCAAARGRNARRGRTGSLTRWQPRQLTAACLSVPASRPRF